MSSILSSSFKLLPRCWLFGDTWFLPDNCCVSLGSELQSEVQIIKILINVNATGSSGSSQPCQLVKAYLQSYYICLVLNLVYDVYVCCYCDIYQQTGCDVTPLLWYLNRVVMMKPGLHSRGCVSGFFVIITPISCQTDSMKGLVSQNHIPLFTAKQKTNHHHI